VVRTRAASNWIAKTKNCIGKRIIGIKTKAKR